MPPLPTPRFIAETCMCLAVRRTARKIAKQYDEAFRPLGITSGQFSILVSVSADRPIGLGKLAEEMGMDRTTLTAAMKPLERDGLIKGHTDPDDGRGRRFVLTAHGRVILDEALPFWTAAQSDIQDRVGRLEFDRLRQGVRTLV